jgi:hypothetical protein
MTHPYEGIPPHQLWLRSIAGVVPDEVDPVVMGKFKITPQDKVATAGLCFARNIARHLKAAGFNYYVSEPANPIISPGLAEKFGYGIFTARYGNIYTPRQLLQTLRRAYGEFHPVEDVWQLVDGRIVDPFRPQIQPDGFISMDEFNADRRAHFAAIRRAVEQLDVLVFTLGLTETWYSRLDGAVFPVCPGVAGGQFDDTRHGFLNFSVTDIITDLEKSILIIREKNPTSRFILTVSPVPLVATAIDRSVLVSTTYSKSVLRVAAEEIARYDRGIAYFPSYEIITGSYTRGAYFADDLQSVTEAGVSHVMKLFLRHYADGANQVVEDHSPAHETAREARMPEAAAVMCDEKALDVETVANE